MAKILLDLGINWQLLCIQIVGFLIIYALLRKFAFGPVNSILAERRDKVAGELEGAAARRQEAEALHTDYSQRLAAIEQEAREKIQQATREALVVRNELLDEARLKKDELIAQATAEIEREKRKALVDLRDQIANLAVNAAEQVMRQRLDAATQRTLIDEVVRKVGA